MRVGEQIDRYQIIKVLGEGTFGRVYAAEHLGLGSHHALKVVRGASGDDRRRVLREGMVQATLRHPGVVAVTDMFELHGDIWIVADLVEGRRLSEWWKGTAPTWSEAVAMLAALAEAVGYAHSQGVIHRDLKPANIMVEDTCSGWVPRVIDFGIARALSGYHSMALTRPDTTIGTPAYMAPEQMMGHDCSTQTDVFALGCIGYELLSAARPFPTRPAPRRLEAILQAEALPLAVRAAHIPPPLCDLIMSCMDGTPAKRPADGMELQRRLRQWSWGVADDQPSLVTGEDAVLTQLERVSDVLETEVAVPEWALMA